MRHGEKKRYPTESAAIRKALTSSKVSGRPMRVYPCPVCKGWHLTKKRRWRT